MLLRRTLASSSSRALGRLAPRATPTTAVFVTSPCRFYGCSEGRGDGSLASYLSIMDSLWNRQWFGTVRDDATAAVADGATSSLFADAFVSVQSMFGVEAWAVIIAFGMATRLCTLYFSFYGERATARMKLALPELKTPQETFNRVYYNDSASSLDVQIAASVLKGERRRVFTKYSTSNAQCLTPFLSTPFVLGGLHHVSSLCENTALDVGVSSFLWCHALAMPDPTYVLPVTFCVLTLINFELSLSKDMKRGWMSNIIWGARLGCVCVIPVAASFRSGVCLYFIGMSVAGLLQPLLLRLPAFRRLLQFPTADLQQTAQKQLLGEDEFQTRMTMQFPYLSHILRPQVEENGDPVQRSPLPTAAERPRQVGKFAIGANPLMKERPIRAKVCVGQGSTEVATPTPRGSTTGGKGSLFASPNWKATQVNFSEEDFLPSFDDKNK